ncbi:MAG: serine protease [Hyphomonadaceae bacterium]
MRVPDWLLYVLVLGVVLYGLFSIDEHADAPPAPPSDVSEPAGALLPPPSSFDPEVLVEVGPVSSGVGTAFSIDDSGWWVTARHVVDACSKVGIVVGRGSAVAAQEVKVARAADLALVRTPRAPEALALDLDETTFRIGQAAYHLGYPQGRPGEAATRLMGREKLIARGRYALDEPVLAWAEVGRTGGLSGTLSGMSGGPVMDSRGNVIGVTIAESVRRGRIYTATPASISRMLEEAGVKPDGESAGRLTMANYGPQADRLRRDLSVAQVVCVAPDS